ncbi:cucumisin [Medicago truncatula]|uniref:cucumisin n=1 Tax=Medicago truncatula TaxID=3880 RepID=UPI000D2F1D5E|nr:cucumisin [Medicago truncatula]
MELTEDEANKIGGVQHDGVVFVFPNEKRQLLTTRSWDFIGLPLSVERAHSESDIIIGVIDSGIWPESSSFNVEGLSSPPRKWKCACQAIEFKSRHYKSYYPKDFFKENIVSLGDTSEHGTHTTSTAVGNPVSIANMFGLRKGTIKGGASSARIVVYKINTVIDANGLVLEQINSEITTVGLIRHRNILPLLVHIRRSDCHYMVYEYMKNRSLHNMLKKFERGEKEFDWLSRYKIATHRSVDHASETWGYMAPGYNQYGCSSDKSDIYSFGVILGVLGTSLNTFDLKGKLYPIIYSRDVPNKGAGFNGYSSRY